jgi:hypothetical protein
MVNTWEGWREMRLGAFAKRHPGRPAPPERWDRRRLPRPHARVLFAAVETAERFGPRIRRWAARLGIRDPSSVTVLGDGADWIWRQAGQQLPGAPGLLDIFHALGHIWACAHAAWGEGSEPARQWAEQARAALLRGGEPALAGHIAGARRLVRSPAQRRVLGGLARYFERQADHLGYAARLEGGRSIGSGLVEGACKEGIGKRL